MPGIVLRDELSEAVQKGTFIQYGDKDCCKGIKYDFRINGKYATPECYICKRELKKLNNKTFVIEPGEMAFIVTEEVLALPENMFCHLKADTSCSEGILALDGLCIEPGYRGHLLFGLFNSSGKTYFFKAEQKFFSGIFYKLEAEEAEMVKKNRDFMYDLLIRPKKNESRGQTATGRKFAGLRHKEKEWSFKMFSLRKWLKKNKLLIIVSFLSLQLGGLFISVIMLLLKLL